MLQGAGIILSGGRNTRMGGKNKAFLAVRERGIIEENVVLLQELFSLVIVVTNEPEAYRHLRVQLARDRFLGMGPLGGIQAGLAISPYFYNFVMACDMPFVDADFIRLLLARTQDDTGRHYDVVVPRMTDGSLQPLAGVYSRNCLGPITSCLEQGISKIIAFYPQVRVRYLEEPEWSSYGDGKKIFFNVNTPEDLAAARNLARRGGSYLLPVISIVGRSDAGKTTLIEKLVPELKRRGYRVGTIKHDAHQFEIDVPGKDSWRHRQAGADVVAISSREQLAVIQSVAQEQELDAVAAKMAGAVDIILTEGYKRSDKPKIEVHRAARGGELLCSEDELLAVATDEPVPTRAPCYDINDARGLADIIEEQFLGRPPCR